MAFQGVPECACGRVPQTDGAVHITAGQGLSIGAECHAVNPSGVTLQGVPECACGRIPQTDGEIAVPTDTDQESPVGTECHVPNRFRMVFQDVLECACGRIPQATVSPQPPPLARVWPSGLNATLQTDSVWPSRVCWRVPVAMFHRRTMLSQPPLARVWPSGLNATLQTDSVWPSRVCWRVPVAGVFHRGRFVTAATGQGLAVGAECHAPDRFRMAFQGVPEGACGRVPQADGIVAAATGQGLAVRAECYAFTRTCGLSRCAGGCLWPCSTGGQYCRRCHWPEFGRRG